MGKITVYSPEEAAETAASGIMAKRGALPPNPILTLVENGKPNARRLLQLVAERIRSRVEAGEINIHSKHSAAKPLDAEEAKRLAKDSHLAITGIGD